MHSLLLATVLLAAPPEPPQFDDHQAMVEFRANQIRLIKAAQRRVARKRRLARRRYHWSAGNNLSSMQGAAARYGLLRQVRGPQMGFHWR